MGPTQRLYVISTTSQSIRLRHGSVSHDSSTNHMVHYLCLYPTHPAHFSPHHPMATNSLQYLTYRHHTPPLHHRHLPDSPPPSLKLHHHSTTVSYQYQTISISSGVKTYALSGQSTSTSGQSTTFDVLHHLLASGNFLEADNETRRLIISLAGEPAIKRGYVFFSEVQFIPTPDLKTIDNLWRKFSNNKFGYSVQKRLWLKSDKNFTTFFIKVGWMKKLDTEIVQYNYRAFPDEFVWELNDETPEGHLPLTNALRGTQLLNFILTHPAFADEEDEVVVDQVDDGGGGGERGKKVVVGKGLFNTNYSF